MKLTVKQLREAIREAIKKQTELPPGTVIKRVDPGVANATPLWKLRRDAEQAAAHGQSKIPMNDAQREKALGDQMADDSMHAAEQEMEFWADQRAAGVPTDTSWENFDDAFSPRRRR